jgi:hypothetical protein
LPFNSKAASSAPTAIGLVGVLIEFWDSFDLDDLQNPPSAGAPVFHWKLLFGLIALRAGLAIWLF